MTLMRYAWGWLFWLLTSGSSIDLVTPFVFHSIPYTVPFHSGTNHRQSASSSSIERIGINVDLPPIRYTTLYSSRTQEAQGMMQDMRSEIAKNEDANLIMQALRGQNLNDDDAAVAGLQMRLVEIAGSTDAETGLPYVYNPIALQKFFRQRPLAVATRIWQLLNVGGGFAITMLLDRLLQRTMNNPDLEVQRAAELRDLLTSLGPFYIKVGQALSIRPDVLSPRSMVELQKLCDKVPSYDSKIAFAMLESELGKSVDELFTQISPEPVAAASLGQVYQATLRDTGDVVAVKIQRPAVLETVSLDLYLAREMGMIARTIPALVQRIDPVALLDEFAFRFYQELDYNLECLNGIRIAKDMSVLPMVVIPKNYPQYTARRVHVAEWIDGEKLSQSTADDVSSLVNLGVITYMTMLLGGAKGASGTNGSSGGGGGSGFFHAE
jgi:aarF domain-containing kinase